jgi:hypothetical protein
MILGLDISTSITGFTFLDENGNILEMSHIELKKVKGTLWDKVDFFEKILIEWSKTKDINSVFIEEPLSKFSRGKSSSATISLLMRFNGIISYLVHKHMGIDPIYYPPSTARKICEVKLLPKRKAKGLNQKEQTFQQMSQRPEFANHDWPLKRTGKMKDYCYDQMDSYVIALAGFRELSAIGSKFS